MEPFDQSLIYVFILGGVAMLTFLVETFGSLAFGRIFFRVGIPVLRRTESLPTSGKKLPYNQKIVREEGRFLFTENREVFFLSRLKWGHFSRVNSQFPIRYTGYIRADNAVDIVGRIPFASILLLVYVVALFVVIWPDIVRDSPSWLPWVVLGVTVLGMGVGAFISRHFERKRYGHLVEELQSIFEGLPGNRPFT